jgi:hypothetical protein
MMISSHHVVFESSSSSPFSRDDDIDDERGISRRDDGDVEVAAITGGNPRRERKRNKKDAARRRRASRLAGTLHATATTITTTMTTTASDATTTTTTSPPLVGSHKWLGGAIDPNTGDIYGIPSHSHSIIRISPPPPTTSSSHATEGGSRRANISTVQLPARHRLGRYKWLRGVIRNGYLYGIPSWSAGGVLRMDLDAGDVRVLPLPPDCDANCPRGRRGDDDDSGDDDDEVDDGEGGEEGGGNGGRWMWHGGAVAESSTSDHIRAAIYCPPSNADRVLKVRLDCGSDDVGVVETIGPDLSWSGGRNKWYGKC